MHQLIEPTKNPDQENIRIYTLLYFSNPACKHDFFEAYLHIDLKTLNPEIESLSFWNRHWVTPWTTNLLWNNHITITYFQSHTTSSTIILQSINSTSNITVKPKSSSNTSLKDNRNTTRLVRLIMHHFQQNPSLYMHFSKSISACICASKETNPRTYLNRYVTY